MKRTEEAKQKAEELIMVFSKHTDITNNQGAIDHDLWRERAIEYAIIAVEEIRTDYGSYRIKPWISLDYALKMRKYWDDVLKELNKLTNQNKQHGKEI